MTANTALASRIAAQCREDALLAPGERVLVAVSGGADSMALAALLAEAKDHGLPLDLVLGHVDHGWRGRDDADADWGVVRALADRLGVHALRSAPPPADAPKTEAAARRYRYSWLDQTAQAKGATKVAVAHHLGDQAETFLMRLLRSSGPLGLAGIPRRRPLGRGGVEVARPLLETDPGELRAYLRAKDIAWREDPTNLELSRDRARTRARIERLVATHPDARAALAGHANRLRRRVAKRDAEVAALVQGALEPWPWAGAVSLPRDVLQEQLASPLLLSLALRGAGREIHADKDGPWFTRRLVRVMAGLLATGGALDLPHGLRFRVAGRRAWLLRVVPEPPPLPDLRVVVHDRASFDLPAFLAEDERTRGVALDADRLGPDPEVRVQAKDDRFTPFGQFARDPVSIDAWLARHGIPGFARRGTLVVAGLHGVAWVVGRRIDAGHAVTEKTQRVACVRIERR